MNTFCPHGISHQPGVPDEDGRSEWCGECYEQDADGFLIPQPIDISEGPNGVAGFYSQRSA